MVTKGEVGVGVAVGVVAAPAVMAAAGFGAAGVVPASIAAGIQSGIGNVAVGSFFAAMQSAGVLGLAASTKVMIGTAAGTAIARWFR